MNRQDVSPFELPYGIDFCFIDRVVTCESHKVIETEKRYCANSSIIASHFKDGPKIVPGVILVEQMCQSALLLGIRSLMFDGFQLPMLGEIRARFVEAVSADSTVRACVTMDTCLRNVMSFNAQAICNDRLVCKMSGMAILKNTSEICIKSEGL